MCPRDSKDPGKQKGKQEFDRSLVGGATMAEPRDPKAKTPWGRKRVDIRGSRPEREESKDRFD